MIASMINFDSCGRRKKQKEFTGHIIFAGQHGWIQRGGGGGQGVRTTPLKNHKNIGFPSNIDPDPLKSQSYQASIQWWAIIGTQAKGVSLAGR